MEDGEEQVEQVEQEQPAEQEATPAAEGGDPSGGDGASAVAGGADPMAGYKPLKFKDPMELSFLAPMPHKIVAATVPNFMELRQSWRMGMQKIEMDFMDLLQKMNMEFEAKSTEFDRMSRAMAENHAFLGQWYQDMQTKLNEKNEQIVSERMMWEQCKEEVRRMTKLTGEVIPLNVGGTHHLMTELDILT